MNFQELGVLQVPYFSGIQKNPEMGGIWRGFFFSIAHPGVIIPTGTCLAHFMVFLHGVPQPLQAPVLHSPCNPQGFPIVSLGSSLLLGNGTTSCPACHKNRHRNTSLLCPPFEGGNFCLTWIVLISITKSSFPSLASQVVHLCSP